MRPDLCFDRYVAQLAGKEKARTAPVRALFHSVVAAA
jgi:hypothetical protein